MAFAGGGGSTTRGGGSWPLLTVNTMIDGQPQPSLSESLALGTAKAHRQVTGAGAELRNFRRSVPVQKAVLK
jgi:hypothetical protein